MNFPHLFNASSEKYKSCIRFENSYLREVRIIKKSNFSNISNLLYMNERSVFLVIEFHSPWFRVHAKWKVLLSIDQWFLATTSYNARLSQEHWIKKS